MNSGDEFTNLKILPLCTSVPDFQRIETDFISISTVSKLILVLVLKLLLFLLLQIDVKVFVYNHISKEERWLLKASI